MQSSVSILSFNSFGNIYFTIKEFQKNCCCKFNIYLDNYDENLYFHLIIEGRTNIPNLPQI